LLIQLQQNLCNSYEDASIADLIQIIQVVLIGYKGKTADSEESRLVLLLLFLMNTVRYKFELCIGNIYIIFF
jgi:hypothetical protein